MERVSNRSPKDAAGEPATNEQAGGGRIRVLVGWYGIDHSRPEEPNIYIDRLEYPYLAPDYLADPDDPAVGEDHLREITSDAQLGAWAEREFEWWDVRDL